MKKTAITIICILVASSLSFAQTSSVILPFMEVDHNPVTSAMAGASVLMEPQGSDVWASYQIWKPSTTSYFSAGGSIKAGKRLCIVVGGTYGAGKEYQVSSGPGKAGAAFKPSEMMFNAGAAYRIGEKIGAQINAKYASSSLAQDSKYGTFAADVLLKAYLSNVRLAIGAVNLGPSVKEYKIPSAVTFAIAYDNGVEADHRVRPEIDAKYYFCGSFGLSAGMDYTFRNLLSIRAGYHFGGVIADHVSVGLGVNIQGLHIDASYLLGSGVIKSTLCFGLGYGF